MAARLSAAPSYAYGMLSERARVRMVDRLKLVGIQDERVLSAMRSVPRHLFVDQALASRAYDDVALPIGYGQTISHPLTVARMLERLFVNRPIAKILEIGTGCAYQTALLLKMGATVYSIERIAGLLERAKKNLHIVKLIHARLIHGDGYLGLVQAAPFDGIIASAAAWSVPEDLLLQLNIGGRLIMPIGQTEQYLWQFEKTRQGLQRMKLESVKFVPLLSGKQ